MRPRIAICRHTAGDDASAVALALAHTDYAGVEISVDQNDPTAGVAGAAPLVALSEGVLAVRYHFPLGPLELSDPSPHDAQTALNAMLATVEAIAETGGGTLTVHAALPRDAKSGPRFSATVSRLRELADVGRENGVTVCLENLRWGATSDPDVVIGMADAAGTRITLDVGHANSSDVAAAGYAPERFVRDAGERIAGAHVYDREIEIHHAPDDLERIGDTLHALCDVGCDWWTVELVRYDEAHRTAFMLDEFLTLRFGTTD
jgi:sugar phosphate isomerase/epimerase